MRRYLRRGLITSRWWHLTGTLIAVLAIVASACAPAAPPPAAPPPAPPTAPTQPAAAAKPAAAPATVPTTAPALAAKPTVAPAPAATTVPAAPAGQVLKLVLGAEPNTLEPSVDAVKSSLLIDNTMLEPLAVNTPDQKFKPWLAESWTLVAPTKWRMKLKKGVKFHNGEPFDADAVAFSVDVFLKTQGMFRGLMNHISGTEKVDDLTIDIVTAEPSAILPSSLAYLYAFPPKYYKEVGTPGFGKKPIGTGPYRFVEWVPGVQLKVIANPDYWGTKPPLSEIQFRWAPEASSRVALLETGEVHLAQNIPPALVERVEKSGTARIEVVKSIRKVFLQMNVNEGPTKDVRIRKALNHAIDVDAVIKTLFKGRAYGRDKGIILEGFEGYQGDKLEPFKYDPELAKKLTAEAGFPNGFEMPFFYPIGRYMLDKESSEAMAAYLTKIGIKVDLQGMESGAYFQKISADPKQLGVNFFSCGALYMNPLFCALTHYQSGGTWSYGANARTDALILEARRAVDDAQRAKVYQEMENYVYKEFVPWVWLWHQQDIYGASNKVNWKARSDELMDLSDVTFK